MAWMVHFYTFLGVPINFYCLRVVLVDKDPVLFVYLNWLAMFIDATDGTMARWVNVKKYAPSFDGSQLDNITDFLTFSLLPALAIPNFDLVPAEYHFTLPSLVLLASAFQFCQVTAKTNESFVGFPSYWNIVFLYMYVLEPSKEVILLTYAGLALLSFIPVHFIYPSKTKLLRPLTIALGTIWFFAVCLPIVAPHWGPSILAAKLSLLYVAYYVVLSLYLHITTDGTY
eukprot:GGOE01063259.1.p1 GENE.GGOE01063259.1~~GGOE01063259.1.p1  ORF type:complete len:228 (-),score=74.36 GGOE01063259.1:379-1062(-)